MSNTNSRSSIASFFKSKKKFVQEKVTSHVINAQKSTTGHAELENSVQQNVEATVQQNVESTVQQVNTQQQCIPEVVEEKSVLQKKINVLESNLKEAKLQLKKSADINLVKDFKISRLMNEKSEKKDDCNDFLGDFKHTFNQIELKDIKSVGPGPNNDSKFILKIMSKLYKNDEEEKLKNRSANGKMYKGEKKTEISFEKKTIMKDMLSARLKFELSDEKSEEFLRRCKNLNKLIKDAIHNILRRSKDAGKKDAVKILSKILQLVKKPNQVIFNFIMKRFALFVSLIK